MKWISLTKQKPRPGTLVLVWIDSLNGSENATQIACLWRGKWMLQNKVKLADKLPGHQPSHWTAIDLTTFEEP